MAVPPPDEPSGSAPEEPSDPPNAAGPTATPTSDAREPTDEPAPRKPEGLVKTEAPAEAEAGPGVKPATKSAAEAMAGDIYRVSLDEFEGPLDLLLELIKKHELDIFDIPISFITKKYLEYLQWMTKLQIDVASEYLVMAATLAYIKSQMLLPDPPSDGTDEDGIEVEDPRAELVRRLLEYQKYKDAAHNLSDRSLLDRDVFERGTAEPVSSDVAPFAPVSVFKLFEAFDDVLRRAKRTTEHEVVFERISLAERIVELTEMLHDRGRLRFAELFGLPEEGEADETEAPSGFALVVTFLALLEMARLGVASVVQEQALGEIFVEFAKKDAHLPPREPGEVAHEVEREHEVEDDQGEHSQTETQDEP